MKTILTLSLVFMLYANLIGGGNTSGPSMYEQFPTSFSPAPYAFVIWLPIFLGCISTVAYVLLPPTEKSPLPTRAVYFLAAAFTLNGLTAYTPIGYSNLAVTGLLVCLTVAYRSIASVRSVPPKYRWRVRIPVALFLAWALVATILNACQYLVYQGWTIGPKEASLLIILVSIACVPVVLRYRESIFALVLIWAFWGIVAANPWTLLLLLTTIAMTLCLLGTLLYIRKPLSSQFAPL